MLRPNYKIIKETEDYVLIIDKGPWDKHMTITNGVEMVVMELAEILAGRKLFYIDSENIETEIVCSNGEFLYFRDLAVYNEHS